MIWLVFGCFSAVPAILSSNEWLKAVTQSSEAKPCVPAFRTDKVSARAQSIAVSWDGRRENEREKSWDKLSRKLTGNYSELNITLLSFSKSLTGKEKFHSILSESQRYYLVDSKLENPTVMMEATTLEKILKGQGKVPKILILNLDVKAQETPKIYKWSVSKPKNNLSVIATSLTF